MTKEKTKEGLQKPPRSATPTGQMILLLIVYVFASWVVLSARPTDDIATAAILLIAMLAVPGAISELFFLRSWKHSAAGIDFSQVRPSLIRTMQKLVGLWSIFIVLYAVYSFLPVYEQPLYEPFQRVFRWLFPWLAAIAVPYVALVDAVQKDPHDTLWRFGGLMIGIKGIDRAGIGNWLLGWLVKAFFLPLMFCFLAGYIRDIWAFQLQEGNWTVQQFYVLVYKGLFFIDVGWATLGYFMTLRLLGTHIRSTEPTLGGWLVAVVCYPPFWDAVSGSYLAYNRDWEWGGWLWQSPVLYTLWAFMILFLLTIYVWATVVFGLRFSNLTNRGIITNGPYRYTKHPAYISKNLSWWLLAIPFIPEDGSITTLVTACLMLLGVNMIYYLRARTEERHLLSDPVYQAYSDYIDQHGTFRRLNFRSAQDS